MLGLQVLYVVQPSETDMLLALRSGDCDVAASGLELCAPLSCPRL
jgi:hypothetical protein